MEVTKGNTGPRTTGIEVVKTLLQKKELYKLLTSVGVFTYKLENARRVPALTLLSTEDFAYSARGVCGEAAGLTITNSSSETGDTSRGTSAATGRGALFAGSDGGGDEAVGNAVDRASSGACDCD